jgi:hypothetical protein
VKEYYLSKTFDDNAVVLDDPQEVADKPTVQEEDDKEEEHQQQQQYRDYSDQNDPA